MSTIVYRQAVMLFGEVDITAALHELGIDYSAEMLDETTFGDDTRINKGGLFSASISGSGYFDGAVGIEAVMWPDVGSDDAIVAVFPDGITEGSTTTGRGYAMKGVLDKFDVGGSVGALLDCAFAIQGRGIES